jgi:hypothetical protein
MRVGLLFLVGQRNLGEFPLLLEGKIVHSSYINDDIMMDENTFAPSCAPSISMFFSECLGIDKLPGKILFARSSM